MDTIKMMASLQMRRVMKELLTETFKRKLTPKDIEWVRRLLFELRDRVNGLTPNRADLHDEFNAAFDVELNGNIIFDYEYPTRFLKENGEEITKELYTEMLNNGENVYIACFLGCTYHCG